MEAKQLQRVRNRLADPLLTTLTIMLAIILFGVAPLQAIGMIAAHDLGLVFGLLLVAVVFIVSGSWSAVGGILIAVTLVAIATVLRLRQPSMVDVYMDAVAWLIASLTLAVVVARAVFATGPINYHRVIGAVLLYLDIGVIFIALFCWLLLRRTRLTDWDRCRTISLLRVI